MALVWLYFLLQHFLFILVQATWNCSSTGGNDVVVYLPFDKGKLERGYISWVENDENGRDARNYRNRISSQRIKRHKTHNFVEMRVYFLFYFDDLPKSNIVNNLRATSQKYPKFKFTQTKNEYQTLTKLVPATMYQISLHTENDEANQDLSCLVETKQTPPSPPTQVRVNLKSWEQATATFSPPDFPNGRIMKYR